MAIIPLFEKMTPGMIKPDMGFLNFTEEEKLMKELNISKECAFDVLYLRSRLRWSEELEKKLIEAHKNNEPVNILSFGSTKETQQALLDTALKSLTKSRGPDSLKSVMLEQK